MKNTTKILCIADVRKEAGNGHLSRLTSLYEAFLEFNYNVELIAGKLGTEVPFNIHSNIMALDWEIIATSPLFQESDIIIIDSYYLPENICETGKVMFYFWDEPEQKVPQGIPICPFYDYFSVRTDNPQIISGIDYLVLRKEFHFISFPPLDYSLKSVVIALGSSYQQEVLDKIISAVFHFFPHLHIHLLAPDTKENIELESLNENLTLFWNLSAKEVRDLILKSSIVICGGGQILNETICCGRIPITVQTASNQLYQILNWKDLLNIPYAGILGEENVINNIILELRNYHSMDLRKEFQKLSHSSFRANNNLKTIDTIMEMAKNQ